jgi:hypothetical protein
MYWGSDDNITVVGSHAALVARMLAGGRQVQRDALGACWLAYTGSFVVGQASGFETVQSVPAEAAVVIDPEHGARLSKLSWVPWRFDEIPERSTDELVAEVHDDIATSIEAAHSMPAPDHVTDLTGGKDSRLILAVILEAGESHDFRFRTMGADDLPDVVVAKRLAEAYHLDHSVGHDQQELERQHARMRAMHELNDGTATWEELRSRVHVGTWAGMRSVGNLMAGGPPYGDRSVLSGACGEALRTNYPGSVRIGSPSHLDRAVDGLFHFGEADIIQRDARDFYDAELRRVLYEHACAGDAPPDVVDIFYLRNRLRRWFGTTRELDETNTVCPLYTSFGIRTAFALGTHERRAERLHYEIMRRSCASLVNASFHNCAWSADLQSPAPARPSAERPQFSWPPEAHARHPQPEPSLAPPPARTRRDFVSDTQLRREAPMVALMSTVFADPANPVFTVLDQAAVLGAVERFAELSVPAKDQVYGALTAAMWLGGYDLYLPRR